MPDPLPTSMPAAVYQGKGALTVEEVPVPTPGRGQVLAPWPNRLEDATYELDGRRHQLPLNERETGNAIHGLVRWAAWSVSAARGTRAARRAG